MFEPGLILLLSGPIAVGKTRFAQHLVSDFGFSKIRTGRYLADLAADRGTRVTRTSLQALGDQLDLETDCRWIVDDVANPAFSRKRSSGLWFLDSVRKHRQVEQFLSDYQRRICHLHLTAPEELLERRYEERRAAGGDYSADVPYPIAATHPNELASRSLEQHADIVVDIAATDLDSAVTSLAEYLQGRN